MSLEVCHVTFGHNFRKKINPNAVDAATDLVKKTRLAKRPKEEVQEVLLRESVGKFFRQFRKFLLRRLTDPN